jgi:predicted DNA-binding antitoxin AbrB/MazE fold protein
MRAVDAHYDGSVLRPAHPLGLRPGDHVRVVILSPPDPDRWNLERHMGVGDSDDEALAEAGLAAWADDLDREDGR